MFKKFLTILTGALLLAAAGCFTPEEYIFRRDPRQQPTIKIAALLPLSGPGKIRGEQMSEGISFAVANINAGRGVNGKRAEVRFFDTSGTAAGADRAFREAAEWGALGAIAGGGNAEVDRIIRMAPSLRLPVVLPLEPRDSALFANEFIYHTNSTAAQQMDALMGGIYYWRKVKLLGIFIEDGADAVGSATLGANASEAINRMGGRVVRTLRLPAAGELPEGMFKEMLISSPEAIFIAIDGRRGAEAVKKLRASGFRGIICGPEEWYSDEFFNALDNGYPGECIFPGAIHLDPDGDSDQTRIFRKDFRKKFYHLPGPAEALSYDAANFLLIGLSNAPDLLVFDRNWRTVQLHQGAAGVYSMLRKGEVDRTVYLNSIGVNRALAIPRPYPRFSRKFQHSKLKEYLPDFFEVE